MTVTAVIYFLLVKSGLICKCLKRTGREQPDRAGVGPGE